ncbi:hypothetical protein ACIQCF_36695 [Streptomyces sp. NPDC088353]|uniref:hypothetical protein n=1 Tax=unclassified Streptomyces TaxID=2593676 RepID=UPI00369343F4
MSRVAYDYTTPDDWGREPGRSLGTWLDNVRRRAAKLTPQRLVDLDALGMRW